jgi:uncharacterized protein
MKYFLYKLIPPRPTFPQDMTEAEERLIQEHVAYWKDLADRRVVVVFGLVADPKGAYDLAIVEAGEEAAVRDIGTNDPSIIADIGFKFEIYSMPDPILGK